jgi:hypothetical protein
MQWKLSPNKLRKSIFPHEVKKISLNESAGLLPHALNRASSRILLAHQPLPRFSDRVYVSTMDNGTCLLWIVDSLIETFMKTIRSGDFNLSIAHERSAKPLND